jgi:aminoglycoside/choline kinase family phosphotransferase
MKFDPNLEEFIKKHYKDSYTIDKISEEGSNRSYYRISSNTKSMVLCITYPFLKDHDDFIVLTEYLIKKNAKIPKMIDLYQEKGWILLEDGGNYYLQDIIKILIKIIL